MFVIIILTCYRHYDSDVCLNLCFVRMLCQLVVDFYLHCHVYNDTEGNEADHSIIMLSFNFQNLFVYMSLHSNKRSLYDYSVFVKGLLYNIILRL